MEQAVFVVDCRYVEKVKQAFGDAGIFLPSVPCGVLQEPVSCHPDMVLYPLQDGRLVCAPSVFEDYKKMLSPFGKTLVQGKKQLLKDYPGDVAYNVLNVKTYAFARLDATDAVLLSALLKQGTQAVPVAQGYSRCSALAVGDGVITADASIACKVSAMGLSVLKISAGHIRLPGYDYGFIGGASGLLDEKTVAFFGDLGTHPQGDGIRQFIKERGFRVREVLGQPLTDIGTILRV